jgi:hypothetical protein
MGRSPPSFWRSLFLATRFGRNAPAGKIRTSRKTIVKATERRSSVVNDIEPSPGSADELFDHRLLEKLELGLTTALRLVAQSERQAAIAAINALLEFIVSIPGWERRDLGGPLWQLLTALNDLEFGRVGSLLSPNPAVRNRKPDAGMRKILKAYALFCVDVLCRSGWSRTEGCGIVARSLQENGFPLGGRNSSPPWKSVKGWRDRFTKLAEGDQTRATFEGLRPRLVSLGSMTREQAQDFVKGQLRVVLAKMGKRRLGISPRCFSNIGPLMLRRSNRRRQQ